MSLREAAQAALEWIRNEGIEWIGNGEEVKQALRDALAEAEKAESAKAEPVAWRIYDPHDVLGGGLWITDSQIDAREAEQEDCTVTPLYAHAPAALPESAELIAMARRYQWLRSCRDDSFYSCHEKDGYGGQVLKYGVDLDAAIDAAMQEQKP